MSESVRAMRRETTANLESAVHSNRALSRAGLLERLFTLAFSGLVYPQIWEDPIVDMAALEIGPDDHIVAIASGSCNVLSYLTANPASISAVDLNAAHVALGRLKLCAAQHLPDHAAFFAFFGRAASRANVAAYDQDIQPHLDSLSRAYWNARGVSGRRRIDGFSGNFYRRGLLGRFIGAGHLLARLYGCDPRAMLQADSLTAQRSLYDRHLAPVLDKGFVRWLIRQPASLYGLGIPPAQYSALSNDLPGGIAAVLRQRLERLACGFDIKTNYFAWQAFGRRYDQAPDASLPPYLQRDNFAAIRDRSDRVTYRQQSMTAFLETKPARSLDCYVLLDAQDWMTDAQLTALWTEITRTAKPGARVIFRTAADERCLPGRVPAPILNAWTYDEERSRSLGARDRSSIYGAFHLYTLATVA
ncbi:DUF3419 family protein [Lichenihabitans psoromatis]|uniref:DUF3419 family protein n=1 Tax=Lichenihabitans psoromatis TaxID=2528642 RepID=UPI001036D0C6|nr:DUF3419 family protein [Lichenihabitans psoromatis]